MRVLMLLLCAAIVLSIHAYVRIMDSYSTHAKVAVVMAVLVAALMNLR